MILKEDNILFEDGHIIVCHKPSGIATQTAKLGQQDMESCIKNYLKISYIGVVHRLDQPVEGILVFGKTKEAAAKLSAQSMEKRYYAVALADSDMTKMHMKDYTKAEITLVDYLIKNGRDNTSRISEKSDKDAKRAELMYRILKVSEKDMGSGNVRMLAEVILKTGRHHQIRVQLAHAGLPLLGDMKYGSEASMQKSLENNVKNVALCAYSLTFIHPATGKSMSFSIVPNGEVFQPFLPVTP
ncbi:MAG: RluA family pseudouridine synthase [Clostridiales bacterium]|nr:RluA family pseudouridine synthase [Clostridiales bacterium]